MFGFLKKNKENNEKFNDLECNSNELVAIGDGEVIDVTTVNDEVFSQKMLGESIAMLFSGDDVTLCSPANGVLSVMFATGHSYGVTLENGADVLVHIGINTVEANGKGFTILKKQGEKVKAGEPVVKVDLKNLSQKYDMSTMIIITNSSEHPVEFNEPCIVTHGTVIGKIKD